jgi:hypothetical protein
MKKYFVLMFCFLFATFFASCKSKAGSDNPLIKSPMPGVSTTTSPTEPFILKVGDTLEIIEATLTNDNCTIMLRNGTNEKTVHVNVQSYTSYKDINQRDGIQIGTMEDDAHGGSLVLYVYKLLQDVNIVRFGITVDASEGQSNVLLGITCIKELFQSQPSTQLLFNSDGTRYFVSAEINKGDDVNCYFQFTNVVEN